MSRTEFREPKSRPRPERRRRTMAKKRRNGTAVKVGSYNYKRKGKTIHVKAYSRKKG